MCILCEVSKWSRRIVTMLPWLIIPLLLLWALSQLLPPGFRFEVTAPRLACVGVLLFSLCWYELLMPRLSDWRARRSLMMHERRKIEAQEAAKWRKEAIRKCRNCFMAYKDQKPVGGKFMCTFCGHLSKRPALDVPGGTPALGHYICRKDLRMQGNKSWTQRMFENDLWPGVWGMGAAGEGCIIGGQNSGVLIVFRLVSFVGYCICWVCSKVWRGGMSEANRLRTEGKAGQRKGDVGGGQESKAEKLKRKAEEKRLARLEKEQMEAEERMQREEVARLVDERRKQRADAEKDIETEGNAEEFDQRKGKDAAGKGRIPVEEDLKKSKDRAKKDNRKPEDSSKVGSKVVVETTGAKRDEVTNSVWKGNSAKSTTNSSTVKPPGASYAAPKYFKAKTSSLLMMPKKEKSSSNFTAAATAAAATTTAKVNSNEGAVSKPSAWNRISWAWGKGAAVRTSSSTIKQQQQQQQQPENLASHEVPCEVERPSITIPVPTSPVLSPSKVSSSPNKPAADIPPVIDLSLSQPPSLSTFSSPVSTPTISSPLVSDHETVLPSAVVTPPFDSVYSTSMPPSADAFPVSNPYDRWASDLVSKSTWKMWEAPNLELPRLTQSLVKDGLSLHPPGPPTASELSSSLMSLNPTAPAAAANLPGIPISNNIWSNYHAFESTRRIWEGELPSDAPPPPEFVDCITQEVMQDPVIAADGHSYERAAIEKWLKTHDTSPRTGGVLPPLGRTGAGVDKSLRPNHNLRGQIIEYKECMQRGGLAPSNGWQSSTEALKKGRIGSLYSSPGGGSVWAYTSG